jgi:hypothetical protein
MHIKIRRNRMYLGKPINQIRGLFIVVLCAAVCMGMAGVEKAYGYYAGTLVNYNAPSQVGVGEDLEVDTTVQNTGTDRWTAYGGLENYPSYYITFRDYSWDPYHVHRYAQMYHVEAGDTDSRTSALSADELPTAPGSYSVVLECSYHSTYSSDNYTVMQNSPVTINFTIAQSPTFTIAASAGENGSISPVGNVAVEQGNDRVFSATPAGGYYVDQWYLDGTSVQSGGTTYTLADVQANHTLSVTFRSYSDDATVFTQHDFDGDGRSDLAVYYPVNGNWYILLSSNSTTRTVNWGWQDAVPVPGDYDNDKVTDVAVYDEQTGNWYIKLSSGGSEIQNWGWSGARAVQADYDGDGRTDQAVYVPSLGTWYIKYSSGGMDIWAWGWNDAVPVPGDYDGDESDDIAVYYPDTGDWFILYAGGNMEHIIWGWSGAQRINQSPVSG